MLCLGKVCLGGWGVWLILQDCLVVFDCIVLRLKGVLVVVVLISLSVLVLVVGGIPLVV